MSDNRARRLVKGVDRRRGAALAVFHVVDRHAVDGAGSRHRRTDAYARHRYGGTAPDRRLKPRLVAVPTFDQSIHQITRTRMRDVFDVGTYIHNRVADQNAQLEIVKMKQ